jgi:hypothetical protein
MNENYIDNCTVFSICPFPVHEFKPGLYPGQFDIPACLDDSQPMRLVVKNSEHLMSVGGQKRPLRINTSSYDIAKSVVNDFLDGQLYTEPEAHPGICWMHGDMSIEEFMSKHEQVYTYMKETQKRWMVIVVQKTEDDWKKYKNSRVVTDQARFAVRALGIPLPEWMSTQEIGLNFLVCVACRTKLEPGTVVCATCRYVVDKVAFEKLTFA